MVSRKQPRLPMAAASFAGKPPRWLPRPASAPCFWETWDPSAHGASGHSGGGGADTFLRRLEFGSKTPRRAGAPVKNTPHNASSF